jgi:two-component system, OmpR family, phosphate regulon sensor histidine kinase PhoR
MTMAADVLGSEVIEALLARRGETLLVLADDRLRILRAGAEAEALAERPPGDLEGMSLIAAFGSAELDTLARQALSISEPVAGEAELGRLGGRAFAVEAIPLDHGLVLSLHEITTQRRVERVRRDFVANISHELRTPLSSIKLLAETLSSGSVDDHQTSRDFSTQIEREVDHLAQLVDELLDLTMIESGETKLALEAVKPGDVVAELAERIRPVAERAGVHIRKHPASEDDGTRALADPTRLGQALLNLAHNAVKFSHPGGEVRVGWLAQPRAVRFLVADDGTGVPDVHQPRIFERFYKADRSRARARGTNDETPDTGSTGSAGLGLAIVRHIAEAHAGTVGLQSEEGVGSTFWIEIPLA